MRRAQQSAARHIPELDGGVFAPRGERPPVRRKPNGLDPIGLTGQRAQRLAARRIPELDGIIFAPQGERGSGAFLPFEHLQHYAR